MSPFFYSGAIFGAWVVSWFVAAIWSRRTTARPPRGARFLDLGLTFVGAGLLAYGSRMREVYGGGPFTWGFPLPIDWLPIDLLASVLVELALHPEKSEDGAAFFHPLNPHPTTWERLLPSVIEALDGAKTVTRIPYGKWIQRLMSAGGDHADPEQLARIPAIKLMDFYVNLLLQRSPPLETGKTMQASKGLQNVGEIQGEWMKKWVSAWMK